MSQAKRSFASNINFSVILTRSFASHFWLRFAQPFVYRFSVQLYSSYRYTEQQIVIIFVLGHAISIILTPFANYAADMYGRRLIVCLALALYSLSSLLKVVNDYSTLLISSILASCASLLVNELLKTNRKIIFIRYFLHRKDGTHTST